VTALEDGAVLVAGGGAVGLDPSLLVYDGRGRRAALATPFARRDHTATLLADGTVLLAGGIDESGATTRASIYLRSPLGPYANLPTLLLSSPDDPYLPRRPDRVAIRDGQLQVTAAEDGPLVEPLVVAALQLADLQLSVMAGRAGDGAAALLVGYRSDADYTYVTVQPGQPVEAYTVRPDRIGHARVARAPACSGATVEPAELPVGGLAPLQLSLRGGVLELRSSRLLLHCAAPSVGRGLAGAGALVGSITFAALAISR
jgi:hypothetical protein